MGSVKCVWRVMVGGSEVDIEVLKSGLEVVEGG